MFSIEVRDKHLGSYRWAVKDDGETIRYGSGPTWHDAAETAALIVQNLEDESKAAAERMTREAADGR